MNKKVQKESKYEYDLTDSILIVIFQNTIL
jgi:hypothetical protein